MKNYVSHMLLNNNFNNKNIRKEKPQKTLF